MRVLSFKVDAQRISKDPDCDFTGLVSGSRNYLQARFSFSREWDGCVLVARFWRGNSEHAVFIKDNMCDIPPEVLTGRTFCVSVLGKRGDLEIPTNRVYVRQEGRK